MCERFCAKQTMYLLEIEKTVPKSPYFTRVKNQFEINIIFNYFKYIINSRLYTTVFNIFYDEN